MYKLYKITNLVNNKLYVGITKLSLDQRFGKHIADSEHPKYPLHYAIQKYGKDNFIIELLFISEDRKYISDLEEPTIQALHSNISRNGYNVATGGYGGNLGPVANAKRSQTKKNFSIEKKQLLAEKQRIRQLGKTKENDAGRLSQSLKVKNNQFRKGIPHSSISKNKISNANLGKKRSAEQIQNYKNSARNNKNNLRFAGRRASCLCCKKEFDIGNYTLHVKRIENEL